MLVYKKSIWKTTIIYRLDYLGTPQQQDVDHRANTSTRVRITSDSPDLSNSLASNVSQVTVVTTHPPVLIDATSSPPPPRRASSEVVIVANETNKTQVCVQ